MKKAVYFLYITFILLFASNCFAVSAKEALVALKKFKAKCEVGISLANYNGELADAHYEVKEFIESEQAKRNPKVAEHLRDALASYKIARVIWEMKNISIDGNMVRETDDLWKTFQRPHPEEAEKLLRSIYSDAKKKMVRYAYFPDMLSYIWGRAEAYIDKAAKLIKTTP